MSNDHRAKQGDLCMSDAMPYQQHHEYRTTLPLSEVLHDKFFLSVSGNLRVGDNITICRYDRVDVQHRSSKLLEIADVRVAETGKEFVRLHIRVVETIEAKAEEPVKASHVVTAFVQGNGEAKWNVGKSAYDVKVDGKVVATVADKETAKSIARGDIPLPQEAA